MWWIVPALIAVGACAITSIPMGVWILVKARFPSWWRGSLKWPLGDRVSPEVVTFQGWANVLVGSASAVMAVLLVVLPGLLPSATLPVRWIVGMVLMVAVALLVTGCVFYVRSMRLSRI